MRTLKENFFGNLGIGKVAKIEDWLKKYNITKYTINNDWTIDVNGEVDLENYPDKELPEYIQFNIVKDIFNISDSKIISLKGAPKECDVFNCDYCNIETLEDCTLKKCNNFSNFLFDNNFTKNYVLKYIDAQSITL